MAVRRRRTHALVLAVLALPSAASADVCDRWTDPDAPRDLASRIAAIACAENRLWFSPFIDIDGRLASLTVAEAESARLGDGETLAWRRVAGYWNSSGLLERMSGFEGARDCAGPLDVRPVAASCRAFLVDTPWSAVFVSFVLGRAGVPDFRASVRHVDYVREAFDAEGRGPFRAEDPRVASPAPGDLLCFARVRGSTFAHAGLRQWLGRPFARSLAMHCDIVVGVDAGRAHLVGGNLLQGVTRRILPLNRQGRFWGLPQRGPADPVCGPDTPANCDLNRQDWVALLKLDPALARAPAPAAPPVPAPCCTACPLPMPPDLRRCPREPAPTSVQE